MKTPSKTEKFKKSFDTDSNTKNRKIITCVTSPAFYSENSPRMIKATQVVQ